MSGYGLTAGRSEGEELTVSPRGRTNDLPEECYRTVRKESALADGTATRDELRANQRPAQIHQICDSANPVGSSQSGCLKPLQASVYSWHSLGQGQPKLQFRRL